MHFLDLICCLVQNKTLAEYATKVYLNDKLFIDPDKHESFEVLVDKYLPIDTAWLLEWSIDHESKIVIVKLVDTDTVRENLKEID